MESASIVQEMGSNYFQIKFDKQHGKLDLTVDKVVIYGDKINFSDDVSRNERGKNSIRATLEKINGQWYLVSGRDEFSVRVSESFAKEIVRESEGFATEYRAGVQEFMENTGLY